MTTQKKARPQLKAEAQEAQLEAARWVRTVLWKEGRLSHVPGLNADAETWLLWLRTEAETAG